LFSDCLFTFAAVNRRQSLLNIAIENTSPPSRRTTRYAGWSETARVGAELSDLSIISGYWCVGDRGCRKLGKINKFA
jgi:hypothetical protein